MTKKIAATPEEATASKSLVNHTAAVRQLGPRERRLISAIATDWCSRENCDRAVGTTNAPHYVQRLRMLCGEDAIQLRMVDGVDRDNRKCRWGEYRLTERGRERLQALGLMDGERVG